jgi:hypothetical protein
MVAPPTWQTTAAGFPPADSRRMDGACRLTVAAGPGGSRGAKDDREQAKCKTEATTAARCSKGPAKPRPVGFVYLQGETQIISKCLLREAMASD